MARTVSLKPARYTAGEIAQWFLLYNDQLRVFEDSDPMTCRKLQKLLYYAQGCSLALDNRILFNEDLICEEDGPVVSEVMKLYARFGDNGIDLNQMSPAELSRVPVDEEITGLLRDVFETFGQYATWMLRRMCLSEEPWKKSRPGCIIPKERIRRYFLQTYVAHDQPLSS